jgi:hypothetical protein
MDKNVGRILGELDEDGLAEDTIVFFYSDHGAGLPRHKGVLQDSGMKVPLLIRFPERFQHLAPGPPGGETDRLVSLLDFPPTILSLLGLEIPEHMQGTPFLGGQAGEPREYVFGARDRVDEAYDLARSVRTRDYLYIRTFMPHLSYNQPSWSSDQAEIRQEIRRRARAQRLSSPELAYAGPIRPREELYLVHEDPLQLENLVYSDEHQDALGALRGELTRWIRETGDLGFLPEADAWARIRARDTTPYEIARDEHAFPQARIIAAAALVGRGDALEEQTDLLEDPDAAVRYWGAVGLQASERSSPASREALRTALGDASAVVRIASAAALVRHFRKGRTGEADPGPDDLDASFRVLREELKSDDLDTTLLACRAIERLEARGRPTVRAMRRAAARFEDAEGSQAQYIRFSTGAFLRRLGR